MRIPGSLLVSGRYMVEISAEIPRVMDLISGQICSFEIDEMAHDCWGPKRAARIPGVIHPVLDWEIVAK